MAGIKKKVRPINKAKNQFLEWLRYRGAECVDIYDSRKDEDGPWDYYVVVSGFLREDDLYTVYFTMWNGVVKIDYSDPSNRYSDMSIEEFQQLIL